MKKLVLMMLLLMPISNAIIFQDTDILPLPQNKLHCSLIFGGNDTNFCFDSSGNGSSLFSGLFTDLDFTGTSGFSDFTDNQGIANNTAIGKLYINATRGVWISNFLSTQYIWLSLNLSIGNSGQQGFNATGTTLAVQRFINTSKYTLLNGSTFDVIYGARGSGSGNSTAPKGLIDAIKNNTAQGKVYLNGTTINLRATNTLKLISNTTNSSTAIATNIIWDVRDNLPISASKIFSAGLINETGQTLSLLSLYPNLNTYQAGFPILALNEKDGGGMIGFINEYNNALFSGMALGGGASSMDFVLRNAAVFGTISGGIQLIGGVQGQGILDTANGENLEIHPRAADVSDDALVEIIPRGDLSAFTNRPDIDILRISDRTGIDVRRFGVMMLGGIYIRPNSTIQLDGRRGNTSIGKDKNKNAVILSYEKLNLTQYNQRWFNVSVASQFIVNSTIASKKYNLSNGSGFDIIYGSRADGNVTPAQLRAFVYNGTLPKQTAVFNGTLIKLIAAYNSTLLKQTAAYNGTLLRQLTAYNSTLTKLIIVYNGTLAKSKGDIRNNTNQVKTFFNNSLWSFNQFNFLSNLSFAKGLSNYRGIINLNLIQFSGNGTKRYQNQLNLTDNTGKFVMGFTSSYTTSKGGRGANITINGNNSVINNCMVATKNNGSWFLMCNGKKQWSGASITGIPS